MASYNIFNYNYRPAKSIERKLFAELLKEIYGVFPGKDCTYIGLGSVFFSDFKLIHKELGINLMINIEKNEDDKKRFEFNKPFSCIKLKWGETTAVLPCENWEGRKIIWLDYDKSLQPFMFEDIDTVFTKANSGSFYLMSCNSKLSKYVRPDGNHNISGFENDFDGLVPDETSSSNLTEAQSPQLIYNMITSRIKYILELRNSALDDSEKLIYHQLLFIEYKDGAPMMTLGGYLLNKNEYKSFSKKSINKLSYVRLKNKSLDLMSPVVTNQELDLMNNYLPKHKNRFMRLKKIAFIPEDERKKYQATYRYYPNYVEVRD